MSSVTSWQITTSVGDAFFVVRVFFTDRFATDYVPFLKNLDILTPRIVAQQIMLDTLQDTKAKAFRGLLQRLANLFVYQIHLTLIKQVYSHQPLKLQCELDTQTEEEAGNCHVL